MSKPQYLDIENWSRREQYLFFKEYENPFFNICTMLNIKNLLTYCKENDIPLSHAYFYLSQKVVNEVPEMRYRIKGEQVIIHDKIDAGWVMMKDNGSIRFCYLPYTTDFTNFRVQIAKITHNIENIPFDSNEQRDNLIYYSVLPWIHFTGLSHAHRMPRSDSVPRIVFGKYKPQGNEINMPVAVEVNHALMDGFHVAQYLEKLQCSFDCCKELLKQKVLFMKRIILFVGIFWLLTSCQKPLKSWPCIQNNLTNPMIHQQGKQIFDGQGDIIKLKGVNIGGWLLWEGWIWGSPLAIFSMDQQAEKNIGKKFSELVGKKEFENFQQQVYENYIKESDIKQIKDLGFNLIRVPINHTVLQTDEGKIKEHGFQLLDRLLDWAEKYQVYVMLDLHSAPGGQFDFFVADPDEELLWDSPRKKQQTIDLWQAIAKRYAQRKIIAGYDLLNESVPPSPEDLIDIYQEIISAIRKVDQYHMIVIEGNNIAKEFWPFVQPFDNNQMYEFHIYNWFGDDRTQRLARLKEVAEKHCTPIWCGEFGENTIDMISSTREMFDNEQYIVGWAFWTWKKVPATQEGYPYLMGIHMPENWHKLIRWACRGDQKPSLAEVKKALQEFIDSLQKQGTLNSDMIVALRTH